MSKKLRYRTPIVPHLFRKAVYHEDRCQHCGHGMPYNNPDGSAVHEQEAARRGVEVALKMSQRKPEYYAAYDQALAEDQGSVQQNLEQSLRDAANGADQFLPSETATAPELITEFAGQEMRERVAFVIELTNGRGSSTALVDIPVRIWQRAKDDSAAAGYSMQAFINSLIALIDEERDAGHRGVLEVSSAHRRDARNFREHVANTAVRYAITHNWCDEVLACLADIGIAVGPMHVTVYANVVGVENGIEAHLLLPYDEIPVYRNAPIDWALSRLSSMAGSVEVVDVQLGEVTVLE